MAENAHAEELGFRDFSSLFLVKENRRQLGNSACCISFIKGQLNIASICNGRTKVLSEVLESEMDLPHCSMVTKVA